MSEVTLKVVSWEISGKFQKFPASTLYRLKYSKHQSLIHILSVLYITKQVKMAIVIVIVVVILVYKCNL